MHLNSCLKCPSSSINAQYTGCTLRHSPEPEEMYEPGYKEEKLGQALASWLDPEARFILAAELTSTGLRF